MAFDQTGFRRALLSWYRNNGRHDLPWRKTRDPYAILVSEVMLQQTQVATVIPYYNRWLRRFSTPGELGKASEQEVLSAWQGLGYYARARNLRSAARTVMQRHGGRVPRDIEQIRDLPGIGKYTANAIASFAFDRPVPIVEANTSRVLARLFDIRSPIDQSEGRNALWERASELVPRTSARVFNSAMIDLGALICLPSPKCSICPVNRFCRAENPAALPHKKNRARIKNLFESHALVIEKNRILLEQSHTRWRGMWILPPLGTKKPKHNSDYIKQSGSMGRPVHTAVFPFTNHRVTLRIFRRPSRRPRTPGQRWFALGALEHIPIPSPHRRALNKLVRGPSVPHRPRRGVER